MVRNVIVKSNGGLASRFLFFLRWRFASHIEPGKEKLFKLQGGIHRVEKVDFQSATFQGQRFRLWKRQFGSR